MKNSENVNLEDEGGGKPSALKEGNQSAAFPFGDEKQNGFMSGNAGFPLGSHHNHEDEDDDDRPPIGGGVFKTSKGISVEIREVWADNLDAEMNEIRKMAEKHHYIAMDTEFPGVVARPIADYNSPDYQYQTLRCNVDLLKIIQLGLAFVQANGDPVPGCCCWQVNFRFSLREDMYAQESIDLLKGSGISFAAHERRGVDPHRFGELLTTSGLVLMDRVKWVSFHSGYDFGYLLKLLTAQALPAEEGRFFEVLKLYFPNIFDIKYLVASVDGVHGGLQRLAEELDVERVGPMHQAGSDSLLTASTFFKVVQARFGGVEHMEAEKFVGQLYGLGGNATVYKPKGPPPPPFAAAANGEKEEG
mmetsp:Transcript_28061/g.44216  ORF Transcript_28061/g.44216 Transcript_28061/m.44216 type:complete len:360 (-) Transcript_28061:302-1381(-)